MDLLRTIALTTLFALLACFRVEAAECNRFAVSVATDAVPHQYPGGREKAHALLENVPDRTDTILIGDSLLANWPQDMAEKQFGPGPVWNFAVGGSVSQNTLWQLRQLGRSGLKPKRLIVLIGTNNLTREDMPACAIAAGIKAVAMAAHGIWPQAEVNVMGIPPRGLDFRFRDAVRLAINDEIAAWARTIGHVRYFAVDDSEISCGRYDRPIEVAAATPEAATHSRCANYADDFGHFRRAGYEVISAALRQGGK